MAIGGIVDRVSALSRMHAPGYAPQSASNPRQQLGKLQFYH